MSDFSDRAEGDTKSREKIPRFQAIIYFRGQNETADFLAI